MITNPLAIYVALAVVLAVSIFVDFRGHKDGHEMSFKESSLWSLFWIGMEHIAAGAVGYMMGRNSGNNSNYDRNHTVVNKTIVNKTYVNQKPSNVYSGGKSFSNPSVPRGNTRSFSSSGTYKSKPVKYYSGSKRKR